MVFDKKEYNKKYRQENKKRRKEYRKKYNQENKEKIKKHNKEYYQENKEKINEHRKEYYQKNKEKSKEYHKNYHQERKELAYNHYGNGVIQCICCGEKEIDFLSLDHIYNNGAEHRKKIGKGIMMLNWAIKNNFPPIFQLLCMNCNVSKGKKANNCKCIHQIKREEKEKRKQEENQP